MRRARRGRRREAPGNEVPEAGLSCGLACGAGSKCRAGILDRGVRNWIAECPEMLDYNESTGPRALAVPLGRCAVGETRLIYRGEKSPALRFGYMIVHVHVAF